MGAALAALAVAAPALAGVPGVWRGALAPGSRPTLTTRPPQERLLVELGALRRPAIPADRSPTAMLAVTRSGPLSAVSVNQVRYVGVSPIGDPLYLVPYRSRVRILPPREGAPGQVPAPKRVYNGAAPTSAARARRGPTGAQEEHIRSFLSQPGVCLIGVAAGTPEIDDCATASEIADGVDYATVGAYRSHPEAPGEAESLASAHVVASVASGIVPDDVARVALTFHGSRALTLTVHNNYFAFLTGPGEGGVPAITWIAGSGRILRRIPAG
ncbi:MAG: hypothetical protein ACLQMH_15550 [Solirubrobacteraceae bacterium]